MFCTLLVCVAAMGATTNKITAETVEGVSVRYTIISEADKTCSVGGTTSFSAVDNQTEGTVTIPADVNGYTVVSVSEYAFYDCEKLTEVILPETVTKLDRWAFMNCGITSMTLPDAVKTLDTSAFLSCANLVSVCLPSQLTSIGAAAFQGCSSLQSIDIPEGIKYIQGSTFKNCSSLRHLGIPSTVQKILAEAFMGCSSLTEIVIPNVEEIGKDAFNGCTSLREATIGASTVSTWFRKNESLERIVMKSTVKKIETYAFENCKSLQYVELSDSLTSIGNYAFRGDSLLTEIELPASLTSIGSYAFSGCQLQKVTSCILEPFSIGSTAFGIKTASDVLLIVPEGTRGSYLALSPWKDFLIYEEGETIAPRNYTDDQGLVYTMTQTATEMYYSVSGYTDGQQTEIIILSAVMGYPVTTMLSNSLKDYAALEKITLPAGLTVRRDAFSGCTGIKTFVFLDEDPSLIYNSFPTEVVQKAVMIVPIGTKDAYRKRFPSFIIFEQGEALIGTPRHCSDAQGVNYELKQNDTSYYYSVVGGSEELTDSITLPSILHNLPVTTIVSYAFKDRTSIKWLSLPKIISGAKDAFTGCHLTLAVNDRMVGGFSDCHFIDAIELGSDVNSIDNRAFQNCDSLKHVTMPATLTYIGQYAFSGCKGLRSIIPTNAGADASVDKFYLPDSLTTIGDNAFNNCTALSAISSVTIPEKLNVYSYSNPLSCLTGVEEVNWQAATFANWFPSVKKLTLGKNVSISERGNYSRSGLLAGCSALETIVVDENNAMLDSREGCNAIVRTTDNILLAGCSHSFIPSSVKGIDSYAFQGCDGLKEVMLNAGISRIGNYAFNGCTGLERVTSYIKQPFSLSYVFDSVTKQSATLVVPFATAWIYKQRSGWDFQTVEEMEGEGDEIVFIEFADSLTKSICLKNWDKNSDGAISLVEACEVTSLTGFRATNITSFDELRYFTNIKSIPNEAFYNCKSLTSILLPDSITAIGGSAFYGCAALESIVLPSGVTSIESSTFNGCANLKTVTLPDSLKTLGEYAFNGCASLTDVPLPETFSGEIANYAFNGCSSIEEVSIPRNVTKIGYDAFNRCTRLSNVELPEGLNSIGGRAFSGTALLEMTLPSTLTYIGDYALAGKIIHSKMITPISVGTIHSGISVNNPQVILYVPKGSEEAYAQAEVWKKFIIMTEGEGDETIDWTEGQVVVTVDEPEQLRLKVVECDEELISRLKIVGPLNSVDLAYIIEGKGKIANLESLDLSDVTLVYDGGCYRSASWSGIGDTGFSGSAQYYYLDEEERVTTSYSMGISPTTYFYYYGPNLMGVFENGPYKHVVMPRSVKKMAGSLFSGCKNLTSFEFPGTVITNISGSAFSGCISLKRFDFEHVDSIFGDAFYNCIQLEEVTHLDHVKYIGIWAFENCILLNRNRGALNLSQIDSIPHDVFKGCQSLSVVQFSDSLRYIGENAFADCVSLTSVSLPASVKTLNSYAFSGCTKLRTVECVVENLEHVDYTTFAKTPWMDSLPTEDGIVYLGNIALSYDPKSQVAATAPATLTFREGTRLVADRFWKSLYLDYRNDYRKNVTKLSFPTSLRNIGDEAFAWVEGSTYSPSSFTELTLPEALEAIGEKAFYGNTLTALALPASLSDIGREAFAYSSELTKLTIPESLKLIGEGAFSDCGKLALVEYNATRTDVKSLFSGCSSLERVNVGAKVSLLPEKVFSGCNALVMVKFAERTGNTPLTIGDYAFQNCTNLLSITLPDATVEMGEGAFAGCKSIKTLNVPLATTVLSNSVFNGCSSLTTVSLHDGVMAIGDETFGDCKSLSAVQLPMGLESIGEKAFSGCTSLSSLTIPASVRNIGWGALSDCYGLEKLTSYITDPQPVSQLISLSSNALREGFGIYGPSNDDFSMMYGLTTLYVPEGCKAKYQSTEGWKKFQNMIEMGGGGITATNKVTTADTLYIGAGNTAVLTIGLQNDITDFTAYQFDLVLPLGIEIETNSQEEYVLSAGPRYDNGNFTISVDKQPMPLYSTKVKYRVICLSLDGGTITGTNGALLSLSLVASDLFKSASLTGWTEEALFTQADGTTTRLDNRVFTVIVEDNASKRGDTNGDGLVNVADAIEIVNYILERPSESLVREACDLNGDGQVNVTDVVKEVSVIMSSTLPVSARRKSALLASEERTSSDSLYVAALQVTPGAQSTLSIALDNPQTSYLAFQFDLFLPEELILACDENGQYQISLNGSRIADHVVSVAKVSNGAWRFLVMSFGNIALSGTEGNILSVDIEANGSLVGSYEGRLDNVLLTDDQENSHAGQCMPFVITVDDGMTGLENLIDNDRSFNVYTPSGMLVRRQTTSLQGLPKGVYLVEGKKIVVR